MKGNDTFSFFFFFFEREGGVVSETRSERNFSFLPSNKEEEGTDEDGRW